MGGSAVREIFLGEDFDEVVVNANGASVRFRADGSVDILKGVASASRAERKPGDKMPDGTVYAGISPDTNRPMYTTPNTEPGACDYSAAKEYAKHFEGNGHKDWRVPTRKELNVLFNNRAAIGGFNKTGSYPAVWYRSSSRDLGGDTWAQRLRDGCPETFNTGYVLSLRLVR